MSQELFEKILERFAGGDHAEEVKRARDEFFALLKDLREDDPSYERLTQCFLNWYVFDRPMDGGHGTPLQRYCALPDTTAMQREASAAMAASVHSIFEVLRLEDGGAVFRDLFTLETLRISERRQLAGLERGDLLEARLLPLADRLVFASGAFIHHPRAATEAIRQATERCRATGEPGPAELMRRLQALTFRYTDRYRERAPVEKVFSEL